MEQVAEKMKVGGDTLVVEMSVDRGEGDVLLGSGGHCQSHILPEKEYLLHEEMTSWEEAEEACLGSGGHLTYISTEEEWENSIKPLVQQNTWHTC